MKIIKLDVTNVLLQSILAKDVAKIYIVKKGDPDHLYEHPVNPTMTMCSGDYIDTNSLAIATDFVKVNPIDVVTNRIDEICSKIKYESNASKPYKTESYIFNEVENSNVSDLIKSDIDISGIKIKPVMDFLVNIGADDINKLKQAQNYDDEDLDTATICTIGIKMFLKSGTPEEVLALKRMILITHLVMQKVSELKAAVSPRKDPDTNESEQKDSAT